MNSKYVDFSKCINENTISHPRITIKVNDNSITIDFLLINFDVDFLDLDKNGFHYKSGRIDKVSIGKGEGMQYYNINKINNFIFDNCKFQSITSFKTSLKSLQFSNCNFKNKCYINNQYSKNDNQISIDNISIKNTHFEENFKLHNCLIKNFMLEDTDFIKNADFFKSVISSGETEKSTIYFKAINFHKLALFGDTTFEEFLKFEYVTFKGYTHFRSSIFKQGLDLEYANIEQEMNFFNIKQLDSKISKQNTSQETYRIIKYQLRKVGNVIGSNKYHSLELKKRRNKLEIFSRDFFDWFVLFIHWIISNHSSIWILPIFWIFVVGFITDYSISNNICSIFQEEGLNNIFKYMSIANHDKSITEKPLIFLLNKVSLGYLYYQFLTSIRKDTRK